MEIDREVKKLLEETVNGGLYQIVLSNARDRDKAFKVKIRPVILKNTLMFQETSYRGTQVFHENYQDLEMIPRIGNYLLQDFKQCEIEHTNMKAVILVSKKGKMTVRKKAETQAEHYRRGRQAERRCIEKRFHWRMTVQRDIFLRKEKRFLFWWIWVYRGAMGGLFVQSMINISRLTGFWSL